MDATALAVVAVGLSVFALLVVLAVAVRVGRLLRAYDALVAGDDRATFTTAVGRQTAVAQSLRREVLALREDVVGARGDLHDALRHLAVVRFDAFGDQAGPVSFSLALLDDAGDGLVLTSLHGRGGGRTYAKAVRGGAGEEPLSPEEVEAVQQAGTGAAR